MNKETRIEKIKEVIVSSHGKPFGKQEIPWKNRLESMDVYQIPLDYLVYNKYNGRILSRTKSLERQGQLIDESSESGKKIIEKLLWDSKVDRNKRTLKNLEDFGQEKVGIITRDGIIIDGNRRAMLLNKIDKISYFKAVVLPVTLTENPIAIEELETRFQLGEDEKLTYNATEKYLKTKELYLQLSDSEKIDFENFDKEAVGKISDWMNEPKPEVEKYLRTMAVMDEYLMAMRIDGLYTQLDDREDQFLFLQKWLGFFYGENSSRAFDGYDDIDVDELKNISFDYIRIRKNYDGKLFRIIADGNRENHLFGYKDIWKSFSSMHFKIKQELPQEPDINFQVSDITSHLNARDTQYFKSANNEKGENQFLENLSHHQSLVGYNKSADEPAKLIGKATDAINAIKTNHKAFSTAEVQGMLSNLNEKINSTMAEGSTQRLLEQALRMMENIDLDKIEDGEVEEIKIISKKISKICYRLEKDL